MAQRIRVDLQTGILGAPLAIAGATITFDAVPDFPTLGVDEFVAITLVNAADVSLSEIVHLTAYTAGDFTGTIARAQEGPAPAAAWPAGTRWDSAPTAEEIDEIEAEVAARVLRAGDTMTGPLVVDEGTDATIEVSSAEVRLTDLAPGAETRAMMSSAGIAVGYTDSGGAILTDAFMDPGGSIYAKASGQNYVELAAGAGRWTSTGKVYAPGFDAISTRITSVADGVSAQDAATVAQVTASAATAVILAPASSSRNVVQPTSSAVIPLVVKGAAAQTANLTEWQNSAGSILSSINNSGALKVSGGAAAVPSIAFVSDTDTGFYSYTGNVIGVTCGSANSVVFTGAGVETIGSATVKSTTGSAASPSFTFGTDGDTGIYRPAANLLGFAVAGVEVARVRAGGLGGISVNSQGTSFGTVESFRVNTPTTVSSVANSIFTASGATAVPLVIQTAAAHSASAFRVESSAGTSLWGVTAAGLPRWYAAGNEQTTVGAAGAASALPATPTKYLKVVDSAGTTLVVPAYAAA